jgi:hypothetical protein
MTLYVIGSIFPTLAARDRVLTMFDIVLTAFGDSTSTQDGYKYIQKQKIFRKIFFLDERIPSYFQVFRRRRKLYLVFEYMDHTILGKHPSHSVHIYNLTDFLNICKEFFPEMFFSRKTKTT